MEVNIESLSLERYRLKPAEEASSRSSSLFGPMQPNERVYASKSQATILHVTVSHRNDKVPNSVQSQQTGSMCDLDWENDTPN